ncbi:MAG: UDP-N-acetylmuramoyl-L-alanine--D-glutamate ligase [Phycisphaerales bacterium]|nr:UDP-N-acetylmuramoyl-L-alanine--D-glutamate ligase [Phycisphaerales bacterium]
MSRFESLRITVMGLGRFGGGVEVTRFLCKHGAQVLVTDLKPEKDLAPSIAAIRDLLDTGQVTLRLGEHNIADFTTPDLIIANPAVPRPWDNRFLRAARAANIPITTEIRLTADLLDRSRTIAITGSNGKSTTSAMIAHALSDLGQPVRFGGNIGGSLLASSSSGTGLQPVSHDAPWTILELSSFMLHWLSADNSPTGRGWSPRIALITNLSPNHLDWHGSLEHYTASKQQLLRDQQPGDTAILGRSVAEWPVNPGVTRLIVDDPIRAPLAIPGAHNQLNAAMARAAVLAAIPDAPEPRLHDALASFPGLPHRLQFIARARSGIAYYNDSKSTTPDATLLAIDAFPDAARIHLIAGGYDKKIDLSPIAARARDLAGLYTIGATGPAIADAARNLGAANVHSCSTLDHAMNEADRHASPGDIILLSPGSASWDQFDNYEQRGDRFAALARQRAGQGA